MTRRQTQALLFLEGHEPVYDAHQVRQLDAQLKLFDQELKPVNVLHVRNIVLYADVLLHHRLHILHRKVIVILGLRKALWLQDNREKRVNLAMIVDL